MSVTDTKAMTPSAEFSDWIAYYAVEAELASGEREEPAPTPDGLGDKIRAVFAGLAGRKEG